MKEKNTAIGLCCLGFIGLGGIHDFYLGKYVIGSIKFLTMNWFMIGTVVDLLKLLDNKYDSNIKNNNVSNAIPKKVGDFRMDIRIEEYDYYSSHRKEKTLYQKTRINKYVNDYVVFDLETTGFNPEIDKIIEIGALKYKNNELVDEFDILVNPNVPLIPKITKLTGITDEMLENCETIDKVLPKFISFIEDYTLVAHNGAFDIGFIETNIKNNKIEMIKNKNIDTLYLARKNITDIDNHKLETLKKYFKLDNKSHRSIDDCKTTQYLYNYCKNKEEKVLIKN